MNDIDIKHACSFTGHRPERLNGLSEESVMAWLTERIKAAIADGYTDFITGMQRGVDHWAAEIILEIRKENDSPLFSSYRCIHRSSRRNVGDN